VNFALAELVTFATGFVTAGLHKLGLGLLGALAFGCVSIAGLALAFHYGVLPHLIAPLIVFAMGTIGFGAARGAAFA
jgi:hypothetical protein